jgi:hypothetical protein
LIVHHGAKALRFSDAGICAAAAAARGAICLAS